VVGYAGATRALRSGKRIIGTADEQLAKLIERVRAQRAVGIARYEGRELIDGRAASGIIGATRARYRAIQSVLRA
jgi:hypothetical protein